MKITKDVTQEVIYKLLILENFTTATIYYHFIEPFKYIFDIYIVLLLFQHYVLFWLHKKDINICIYCMHVHLEMCAFSRYINPVFNNNFTFMLNQNLPY